MPHLIVAVVLAVALVVTTIVVSATELPAHIVGSPLRGVLKIQIPSFKKFETEHRYMFGRAREYVSIASPSPKEYVSSSARPGRIDVLQRNGEKRTRSALFGAKNKPTVGNFIPVIGKLEVIRQANRRQKVSVVLGVPGWRATTVFDVGSKFPLCDLGRWTSDNDSVLLHVFSEDHKCPLRRSKGVSCDVGASPRGIGRFCRTIGTLPNERGLLLDFLERGIGCRCLSDHRVFLLVGNSRIPVSSTKCGSGCDEQKNLNDNRPSPISPFVPLVLGILLGAYSLKSISNLSEGGDFFKVVSLIGAGICFACATFMLLQQYAH